MIGELITLKDPPSEVSRFGARRPSPVKKITSWPISKFKGIYIQKKVFDQNKKAQTHLKSFNGRQWGIFQSISGVSGASGGLKSQNFDFLTQKFKMAQTHLKSFNGRQGGILQSISGVSGASGGLKSQNFDFLTQKFKMAVFARFHFLKSKNPISGHN